MAALLGGVAYGGQGLFEALAGALAQRTDIGVEVGKFAQLIQQANGVPRGMGTTGFLMDQQLAENACPEIICRHHRPFQWLVSISKSTRAAMPALTSMPCDLCNSAESLKYLRN
jgi:hypothetical protein